MSPAETDVSDWESRRGTSRLTRLGRLTRKELREILRDRRTVITLVLMPLLLYPLLGMGFQKFLLSNYVPTEKVEYVLGFATESESKFLSAYLASGLQDSPAPEHDRDSIESLPGLTCSRELYPDLQQAVIEGNIHIGLRMVPGKPVPEHITNDLAADIQLLYNPASPSSSRAVTEVERYLDRANHRFLEWRLKSLGVTQRATPVRALLVKVRGGESVGGVTASALIPFVLILMTITGAVYPAIDLTAGERERGTLEMLIAAPIPRLSVLLAKYLTVLTVALLTAAANLGMLLLTSWASGLNTLLFGKDGLSPVVAGAVFGLLLLFAAFFSALLLVLTSFARSFKEAQAYLIPLMLVSLGPSMFSLQPDLKLVGWLRFVPLLNISLLGRDLLDMQADGVAAVIVVLSTLGYAAVAIAWAARIFGSESVLYNRETGWSDLWRRARRPQPFPPLTSAWMCLALAFPAQYFLQSQLSSWSSGDLSLALMLAGTATVLVFAGLPALAAWRDHVPWAETFAWKRPPLLAWPAALLLGLSLWALAHEVVVASEAMGLFHSAEGDRWKLLRQFADRLQAVPLLIKLATIALAPAVCEELCFRGYFFRALRGEYTGGMAVVLSALVFGAFHVLTESLAVERFLPSALLGLVLGWTRWRTGSLWPGILIHACHNGTIVLMSHYERTLKHHGWGLAEETHLPAVWLGAAGLAVAVGVGLIWLSTSPGRDEGRQRDVDPS